ncbi:MAG: hypothetical protein ACOYNY_44640 [Caldilineaceae bacterium]|jgi:hypothetical protein
MLNRRTITTVAVLLLLSTAVAGTSLIMAFVDNFSTTLQHHQAASPASVTELSSRTITKPVARRPSELVRVHNINGKTCAPWFAPTGDRLLCYAGTLEHPELWLISASEGLEKLLLKDELVSFRWASDDTTILYVPEFSLPKNTLDSPSTQPLTLLNVDTGERRNIGLTTRGAPFSSPSAAIVAFQEQEVVKASNLHTGVEQRILSTSVIYSLGESASVASTDPGYEPTKMPDIFLTPAPEEMIPITTTPIANPLAPGCFPPSCDTRFLLSPNGKKLAVHQILPQGNVLLIIDVATQGSALITKQVVNSIYPFGWSPDSNRLAYATVSETTRSPELWLVDADGIEPRLLGSAKERTGIYEYVTWLPNGVDIVYVFTPSGSSTSQGAEYQIISVEGGDPFTLFTNGYGLEVFDGGRRLLFSREVYEGRFDPGTWIANLSDKPTLNFLPLINRGQ